MNQSSKKLLVASLLIGTFAVVNLVFASSTIGTNINTAGTLTVNGSTTLSDITIGSGDNTLKFNSGFFPDILFLGQVPGTSADVAGGTAIARLVITDNAVNGDGGIALQEYGGNFNANPYMLWINARGTLEAPQAVQQGDSIGGIVNLTWDGSTYFEQQLMNVRVVGPVSPGVVPQMAEWSDGLLIDDIAGTNTFAIKTGLGKVSFGDKVGIGTTTPSTPLVVTAGANATTTVTIGELGLTSSKGCVNMNRPNGQPGSFYLNSAGNGLIVEPNYCR